MALAWIFFSLPLVPRIARADEDAVGRARQRFAEGAAFVRQSQWSEALTAFGESAALHPHPVTTYNIGACERALGRYTRARREFERALFERDDHGDPITPSIAEEARGFLAEIDRVLVRARVTITPAGVALAVDGRPLDALPLEAPANGSAAALPTLVAGTANPAPGTVPDSPYFILVLNPGNHLFTLSRKGYADVVVNRTLVAGGGGATNRLRAQPPPGSPYDRCRTCRRRGVA